MLNEPLENGYSFIETPFSFRNCCWFCAEPAAKVLHFPQSNNYVFNCPHPPLSLRTCQECYLPANKSRANAIWFVFKEVKSFLIKQYQKDLAIGINWTQEELANSEFEGGNFAGFQRSAWFMYEVAKKRVNFQGWPLIVDGINIEELQYSEEKSFSFDNIEYPCIDDAINHYAQAFFIPVDFFKEVLVAVGLERFAYAVRFCRLLVGTTPNERKAALKNLIEDE
ncbi:hypothetical protein [Thalassotalea sp. SU-HH00458]|uniref:hypothetical protein n=1 Tax=Thalassotalea sp. SU-HH00458 TaxID=3127657 RepID=UPI003108BB51